MRHPVFTFHDIAADSDLELLKVYVNGECCLVKLETEDLLEAQSRMGGKEVCDLVLVLSQHATREVFSFTLRLFSGYEVVQLRTLEELVPLGFQSGELMGAWTKETSGGNANDFQSTTKKPT